jgi:hypothetical protein
LRFREKTERAEKNDETEKFKFYKKYALSSSKSLVYGLIFSSRSTLSGNASFIMDHISPATPKGGGIISQLSLHFFHTAMGCLCGLVIMMYFQLV